MKITKNHRNDLILLSILLAVGILLLVIFTVVLKDTGETVVVTVDGKEALRSPLKEDRELWTATTAGKICLSLRTER